MPLWETSAKAAPTSPLRGGIWFIAMLSLLVATATYIVSRDRGYFGDEGSYCTIAQGIIRGGLPYRDYFNEKPPLQYFLTAGIMALSGPDFASVRMLAAISVGLTTVCVLLAALAAGSKRLVLTGWAALTILLALSFSAYSDTAESTLAVIYAAGMFIVLARDLRARRPMVTAAVLGGLFGVACGFRQAALAPALILFLSPELAGARRHYVLGFAVGVLGWVAPVFALGIGPQFVDSTLLFHLHNPGLPSYVRGIQRAEAPGLFLWLLCLALVAVVRRTRQKTIWLVCLLVAMAAPFFGRMDAFRLWPSIAALLVFLAVQLPEERQRVRFAPVLVGGLAFGLLVFVHPPRDTADTAMARFITSRTRAGESIWVAPFSPLYYCLANRTPASRYYFILPWTNKPSVRGAILSELKASRPIIIIDSSSRDFSLKTIFPELNQFISRSYHFSENKYGAAIYERNGFRPLPAVDRPVGAGALAR